MSKTKRHTLSMMTYRSDLGGHCLLSNVVIANGVLVSDGITAL